MHLHSENILLVGSALLLLSILGGKTTSRWGVPTLLFFLLVGILAGSEGLGGIPFDDPPLAQLVDKKTAGNPFFAIQFLYSLAEEGLLRVDHDAARWCWDLDRIHAKGSTDNVVDLMVGKLARLPVETQQVLRQLACLGNVAAITMLSIVVQHAPRSRFLFRRNPKTDGAKAL